MHKILWRTQNWEDFANTGEDREVRKICRKHRGPIRKTQSKSIWRGLGNGSSTLRML